MEKPPAVAAEPLAASAPAYNARIAAPPPIRVPAVEKMAPAHFTPSLSAPVDVLARDLTARIRDLRDVPVDR